MLDLVRRGAWGLSGRLIASYIAVTLAVVVLVEGLVLGFQVPRLVNDAQMQAVQAQVDATARGYAQQLARRYPGGVPAGTVLGDPGQPARPGMVASSARDGTLLVPAIAGPVRSGRGITAVVAVAADGTVVASSAPARYPPGRAAASELPVQAAAAMSGGLPYIKGGSPPTPYGNVLFWVAGPAGRAGTGKHPAGGPGPAAYVYVQVPWSWPGFVNPVRAWGELRQLGEDGQLLAGPFVLLFAIPAPVEHALLRIAQEACVNAVRHGSAGRLAVSVTRQDGHVELAVRDTGTGFDPAAPHAGSGLAHIRDRVAELGGTVNIDSGPGRGAALTVRVPVP